VVRCVGDKNQGMECAVHNFKEWSVLGTNPLFGSVPHTNFPIIYFYTAKSIFQIRKAFYEWYHFKVCVLFLKNML